MRRENFWRASRSLCSSFAVSIGVENLTAVRELAEQQGGRYVDGIHFTYPGDPLRSMLSLTSYLGQR